MSPLVADFNLLQTLKISIQCKKGLPHIAAVVILSLISIDRSIYSPRAAKIKIYNTEGNVDIKIWIKLYNTQGNVGIKIWKDVTLLLRLVSREKC